jgi:hypothetical protein
MADAQEFICGGSGRITPEAQRELDAFRLHLRNRHAKIACESDCRFCAARLKGRIFRPASPSVVSQETE